MGAITGELSFRILALTLSQPGALFEGRLLIILCTSPVVMGWNANKGVLFGQELRSDSHGSNPSVSWMLKLCSSNDNANEWYMDQPVSLSKQTTLSRPFFFFFFQIIPPPSKMKILVEEEVVPTISVPFRQCRTLWSTSRLILWLGSRSTRPMTADFRLIKTVHGWPPVLQA